jgi:hypothetical protein
MKVESLSRRWKKRCPYRSMRGRFSLVAAARRLEGSHPSNGDDPSASVAVTEELWRYGFNWSCTLLSALNGSTRP